MCRKKNLDLVHQLPKYQDLPEYWQTYFKEIDCVIQENFWGNLSVFKQAEAYGDPYLNQLNDMGYCFAAGKEHPAPYYQSISWVFDKIHHFIRQGILNSVEVIWPARAFLLANNEYEFRIFGEEPPQNARAQELIPPHIFVEMLGQGYFPVGGSIREHTNQSLAEHDLAHYGGFLSSPEYMKLLRKGFSIVSKKMKKNAKLKSALKNFDSVYSLKLYYMIEIFTIIPETKKALLQELLELDITKAVDIEAIKSYLEEKANNPVKLYQYLYRIYSQFYKVIDPIGGESRDILNRVRKFSRSNRLGIYFSKTSNLDSKFDGSSIFSMYQNGCAALENKRSGHPDFLEALREIHAPFIGTLLGTSQLTIEDWVMQAVQEQPNPRSKLYQYLCKSKIWNEAHTIFWAYGCDDYTKIISSITAHEE